jgi:hypothetical protein
MLKRILATYALMAVLSGPALPQTQPPATESDKASDVNLLVRTPIRTVRILPQAVSEALKIDRVPTSEPIPMIIGTYWKCITNVHGFDQCDQVFVVCTDDQSFCTEFP